jgi:hypothetical protein
VLHAGHGDAVIAPRRVYHSAALADIVRQRLLHVDILAGLAGEHGHAGVPMVGRGDMDGVDVLALQQTPEILVSRAVRSGPFTGMFGVGQIDIRCCAILHSGGLPHTIGNGQSARSASHQAHHHPVIGAKDLASSRHRTRGGADEFPSLHVTTTFTPWRYRSQTSG